jgi:peptidoglycan/xylan/chitin deacetylase (PgdA/CDA1 family)
MLIVVKRAASAAAGLAASSGLLDLLERTDPKRANLLRVLTYHRVDSPDAQLSLRPNVRSATPEGFEEQVRHLAAHFHVVSIPEVIAACHGGPALPPRSVLITFDDAYRDFAEYAWPILRDHHLPVTLFVPTAYPDQPQRSFWWDRLHDAFRATPRRDTISSPLGRLSLATPRQRHRAAQRLNDQVKMLPHADGAALVERLCNELEAPPVRNYVLGWDDLRRLAREGVTLGAHTQSHPLMHRIPLKQARSEAVDSLSDLRREIGPVPPIFAYPDGGLNDDVVGMLREEGFLLSFTTAPGINDLRVSDPLRLHRLNVSRQATLPMFRTRLLHAAHRRQARSLST